jgi:PD-(D/E)XK endonuclease
MFKNCKNTKKQGDVGLGDAISFFVAKGLTVSVPLTDSQDYDLIVDIDGELQRVQVKTTTYKRHDIFNVSLSLKGGNSKKNFIHKKGHELDYDFLYVLTQDGTRYFIPKDVIGSSTICLGKKFDQFIAL